MKPAGCPRCPKVGMPAAWLVLALCIRAGAAEPVIHAPESVPVGGLCIVRVDGLAADAKFSWTAVPPLEIADLQQRDGTPVLFVGTSKRGTYWLILAYLDGGEVRQQTATLTIGGGPGPTPEPDPPDPEPDPDPPQPPSGKRTILIVRETADSTPAMRSLVTLLRTGENAAYLTSKGHQLAILDDDAVDANGRPTPILEQWRPHFAAMTLPVVFIIDQETGEIVHKQELPALTSPADVMGILREHGG